MLGYYTEDQTHAWMYWRDEDSVALVAPGGFLKLRFRREWRAPIDSSARMEWRNMGAAIMGETAAGQPIPSSPPSAIVYAKLSSPPAPRPQPIGEFKDLLEALYAACQRGRIDAWGRFDNGKLEQIPPAEFVEGRPKGWTDICYSVEETRHVFRPVERSHPEPNTAPGTLAANDPGAENSAKRRRAGCQGDSAAVGATPIEVSSLTSDKRAAQELSGHESETNEESAKNPPRPGRRSRKRKPKTGYESYLREWVGNHPAFPNLQAAAAAAERGSFVKLVEIAREFTNHCKVDRPDVSHSIPDRIRPDSAIIKILQRAISERAAAIEARKTTEATAGR
jgi:hypothetical protein